MYHVQLPIIDGNGESNWRFCDEKLRKLMAPSHYSSTSTDEDNPSSQHHRPGQQPLLCAETFVSFDLYEAVRNGNANSFVDILEKISSENKLPLPAIFDQVTRAGSSLLHVAAHFGRERIVELICEYFPEILTKQDIKGDTALHVAIRAKNNNNLRVIKIIVDKYYVTHDEAENGDKANKEEVQQLRIQNEYGNTALHEAVICNHFDAVECIFGADKKVAHCFNKLGLSPLYLAVLAAAASGGDNKILTLLLNAPLEKDGLLPAFRGNSPLHAAILKRNSGLIEYILEKRSELIHLKDEKGSTPLHYAASIGYLKGVQILLIRKGTSSNALAWNKKGHLPIHVACKKGHVDIVKELLQLEWPTSMDLFSKKGQNILHVAAKNGQENVVKFILANKKLHFEKQLMVNERDRNGNTALHLAAKHLYPRVLLSLTRDERVDMQVMNNQGLTAQDIVLVRSKAPLKHREYLSLMILYSAGVPQSETARSMLRRRKEPPKIDWIKDRINTLMLVAILIATVTFAAGFALPGSVYSSDDPDPNKRGMAVLVRKPMFQVFSVCNTVAMYSSTLGSFVLLWAQLGDFHLAGSAYSFALHMVAVALVTTSTAFMAAVRLVVSNVNWLANVITVIGSIFLLLIVFVYVLLIFPLGTRNPFTRHVAIILIRILIPFAGTYDKVIAKEHDSNSVQAVNKAKQEELMSDEISFLEDQ
ncbi:hypothetical protein PIB30_027161 [Stylosanthes scabra]|uniref:PGG domain-containing protein n=1 Tax=Stylosanthes scabra TaxID=79078 RepID=A0ABU6Z889_9FABA|nr:hypothetical protein [Stylosanthes scabra]